MSQPIPRPQRIGVYPIEREVGRGGMGIVYLGRDTRLDRPVAIKVLPEAFASDPERLARFEREARLLASLNHPNIASIFGLEESEGRRFLVLEYVEGETLAERVARGPMPVDDAVDVCRQVAAALEAAHEGGVIHRDLKPGNVKLTPAGEVKVLDFGLAKGGTGSGASSDSPLSASPTIAATAATGAGVILGTAAYMSPEQARGRVVDRRTDIWSFGCVLYECLTGRQTFEGETVSDLIAHILKGEPDWSRLPASLPPRLYDLLARCLTKDAKKRLRDIGEARLVLEGGEVASTSGVGTQAAASFEVRHAARPALLAYVLAAVFALTTLGLAARQFLRAPAPERAQRLALPVPPTPGPFRDAVHAAFSPDGAILVTTAADSAGGSTLWLRPLDGTDGRTLPGTEDGALPFWSPGGRFLVFCTQDKLKKVDIRGGNPEVLCPLASYGRGGTWGSRNVIVFAAGSEGPLFQISKDGGTPRPASVLDSTETGHRFPQLAWFDRTGREIERLAIAPGLFESVALSPDGGRAALVRRASPTESDVWLLDLRRMAMTRFTHGPGRVERPAWSPDGARIAFSTDRNGHWDIYQKSVDGAGAEQPLVTSGSLIKYARGWSPDGQTLIFEQIGEKTGWDLWALPTQGDRTPRPLFATPFDEQHGAVSPDGRSIAYISNESGRSEVYVCSYPSLGGKHQVSTSGGAFPKWGADGREIFFFVGTGGSFVEIGPTGQGVGHPQAFQPVHELIWFDPAPNPERGLGLARAGGSRVGDDLRVVLNWRSEVGRR